MAEQPIIIKKVKKGGGHGHHGGAWKVAYADFVTAMMAFFLLMWLLGSTDEETKKGISEYFQNPWNATLIEGESNGDGPSVVQGGGTDMLSPPAPSQKDEIAIKTEEPSAADLAKMAEEAAVKKETMQLEGLKEKIEDMLNNNDTLSEFKDQIKLEATAVGLKIQIVDAKSRPMFKLASSEAEPHARKILKELAPVINNLPNRITINGHTDALPFPSNSTGYSNWELSCDRANEARHQLILSGLEEKKVLRVVGLSSSVPYNRQDPFDPMNRRISIIVMNSRTEKQVLEEASGALDKDSGSGAEKSKTPFERFLEMDPVIKSNMEISVEKE
ncbi:MAG: flagellar motor protein MotB [bacterium]|nr:flagellar motor protein MotB [bacterium]